jgi:quinol monooxygenase YgiN
MILELADIDIKPGSEAAFEASVSEAAALFDAAPGCAGMQLHRSVEKPDRYVLMVRWATIEDHMVAFQGSPAFQQWRALAGPHFAGPPHMHHVKLVVGAR